jgi:hypothetical protein
LLPKHWETPPDPITTASVALSPDVIVEAKAAPAPPPPPPVEIKMLVVPPFVPAPPPPPPPIATTSAQTVPGQHDQVPLAVKQFTAQVRETGPAAAGAKKLNPVLNIMKSF